MEPEGHDGHEGEHPRNSRAFLDSIVEHLPVMVFVKDAAELRFVRFNRAGEELLGYSREDMVGKNDYDFFPDAEADFFTRKDREVLAGHDVVDIPAEPIQTRFKGERILHTQKIPIMGPDGEPEFLLGISEDITDRLQAQAELTAERQTVEMLQRAFLPQLPAFEHVDVAGTYRPAGTAAVVGGDWYDAFALPDGGIGLVVGDVAGHGIAAGSLMAQLRNGARALAAVGHGPAQMLGALNEVMRRFEPNEIATAVVARLDPVSRQLTWSAAGHPPMAMHDVRTGVTLGGPPDGPPLGALDGAAYAERTIDLDPDALVVFYTDGLIERRDETLATGLDRLVDAMADLADIGSLALLCAALCDRLVPEGPQGDDVCVLALRCGARSVEDPVLTA